MDIASGLTLVATATSAGSIEPIIDAVELLYLNIDRETAAFSAAAGIVCPEGCGRCCLSETVEASVLELMPMARALFRSGLIDLWVDAIFAAPSSGPCSVFEMDAATRGNGRCRLYGWRPLICRMFGFATRRDKNGNPAFRACREIDALRPATASAAVAAVVGGLPVPLFASYHLQVASLHTSLGSPLMPINKAFQQAVNRYGLLFQMTSAAAAMDTPQDDPHRGPEGRVPPRLAA
ncbi:MAG: YkgJ family cysteine cluster protein [Pseudomonadota bacterium]